MATVKELLSQIEALNNQLSEVRAREMAEAVAKVRSIVDEYQLSVSDVFPDGRTRNTTTRTGKSATRAPVKAKYKDPATGKTWSGRGRSPTWITKDKAAYLIKD